MQKQLSKKRGKREREERKERERKRDILETGTETRDSLHQRLGVDDCSEVQTGGGNDLH